MKAAIYLRKSTDDSDKAADDKSVEQQRRQTLDFIERKGWTLDPDYIFIDDGISGGEWQKRPALLKLMEAAHAGEFDVLVMRDFNRLGRDAVRNPVFIEKLVQCGVEIWFSDTGEQLHYVTPTDKGMVGMRSTFAEQHRYESSKLGHGKAKDLWAQGRNFGGRVYGYDNVWVLPDGTRQLAPAGQNKPFVGTKTFWQINEAEAAVVRSIFQMFADGHGIGTIVRSMNAFHGAPYEPKPIKDKHRAHPEKPRMTVRNGKGVDRARARYEALNWKYFGGTTPSTPAKGTGSWSASSVFSIMHRERYCGLIPFGASRKVYVDGTEKRLSVDDKKKRLQPQHHEVKELRIVPPELWAAAEARHEGARKTYLRSTGGKLWGNPGSGYESKYLLSGIARCGCCGGSIAAVGGRAGHLSTFYYGCSFRRNRGPNVCTNDVNARMDAADEALLTAIEQQVLNPNAWAYVAERALQMIEEQRRARPDRPREIAAELKKIHREMDRFMVLVADGNAPARVLAEIKGREARIEVLDHELGQWQAVPTDELDPKRLRKALAERIGKFRELMRSDAPIARQALRKLLLPKSLRFFPDVAEGRKTMRFEAKTTAGALLDPRYIEMASPRGFEPRSPP